MRNPLPAFIVCGLFNDGSELRQWTLDDAKKGGYPSSAVMAVFA